MLISYIICSVLFIIIIILSVKNRMLKKTYEEIRIEFGERLKQDTNTPIMISSTDKHAMMLTLEINKQLKFLKEERHRYQNGDIELKEAITNISHDLRTPLTAIFGYLDLLESEEKSEVTERYLSIIKNRCEALKQLTEELFRYSVITSTVDSLHVEELSVNTILEDSISSYYAALKKAHITPTISIPEVPVIRKLDRESLCRIFGNIINNAIKYSEGDLEITLSESCEITFANVAKELDQVMVGRLFDRFYTVETGRNSTGIGLSIAKLLVEEMNGKISANYINDKLSITLSFEEY